VPVVVLQSSNEVSMMSETAVEQQLPKPSARHNLSSRPNNISIWNFGSPRGSSSGHTSLHGSLVDDWSQVDIRETRHFSNAP